MARKYVTTPFGDELDASDFDKEPLMIAGKHVVSEEDADSFADATFIAEAENDNKE